MVFWFLLLLIVVVAALPFWYERRLPKVGKTLRKGAPGGYARLSQGVTYYQWFGPARGPVVVAVHGLSTPSAVWTVIAEGLGRLGYRVLVYDLYGRGLSDAPAGEQDAAFFHQQLLELLAEQQVSDSATLIGYSMGGAVATSFAASHPDRVSRLILLAPSGILMEESAFDRFCRQVPFVGDWLHLGVGRLRMMRAIRADNAPSEVPQMARLQEQELRRRGFLPSVLASRRGILSETLAEQHRTVSRLDIPVVAIWGARDQVIPIAALGQLAQWNRLAKQEVIDDAGHALPYSHGTIVNELLRSVLAEGN